MDTQTALSEIFTGDITGLTWKLKAACSGLDSDMFHSSSASDHERCKEICATCPVVEECLAYALPFDRANSFCKELGIYGGLTAEERRIYWDRIRRSKQPARRKISNA